MSSGQAMMLRVLIVELRTDRWPIGCVSRSNLRGDADFLKTKLRLLRRLAPRLLRSGGSTMRADASDVAKGDTPLNGQFNWATSSGKA